MSTPHIQSVGRAFSLLSCLARSGRSESLRTLASDCGLRPATAHRILSTLQAHGVVMRTSPGGYRLGMGILELARNCTADALFSSAATPTLRKLTQSVCPTAHLGVLDADFMVIYLAKATRKSLKLPTVIGSRLEAYCTGLGKVLLAALDPETLEKYLQDGPFIALTDRTITTPDLLIKELEKVRRQKFAVDDRELFENIRCVAVPVFDHMGNVVSALSASFPSQDFPKSEIRNVADKLHSYARYISEDLYPSPPQHFCDDTLVI